MTLAQNGHQLGIPGKLSTTGWEPPEDLSYEQWAGVVSTILAVHEASGFWFGDAIRYGKRRYGETYTQWLRDTDYEPGSLRNMVYVSEKVELSFRNDNLSFTHHVAVAPLEPEKQREMLDRAEAEGLTVVALRSIIKADRHDGHKATTPEPLRGYLVCPECSYRFPRSKSTILAMFDDYEIEELQDRFPGIDLDYEAQRFTDYWAEGRKKMTRPRHAYRNWLENAWKFKDAPKEAEEWV
jgi:hypothetical protein